MRSRTDGRFTSLVASIHFRTIQDRAEYRMLKKSTIITQDMTDAAHWTKPIPTQKTSSIVWWKRTGALVTDILIFQLLIVSPFSVTDMQSILKAAVIVFTLFFAYLVSMQYLIGQTVGMMLFSYRVKEASIWQMMLRNLFVFPIFPIVLLWVIDPLWLFMKGERLSERWSKTKVVAQ